MRRILCAMLGLLVLPALAACGSAPVNDHVPKFATGHFEPFNRADTVAIALREWRLFGQPVDDESASARPEPLPGEKPERQAGLWERVGEYWWIGIDANVGETAWTGKHDENGSLFPASDDGRYAWSAAFISYVMRIAGAGNRFPYSPNHATYVNAAASRSSPILRAYAPERYAPRPGDLICLGRYRAAALHFADLPTDSVWPGHCAIVTAVQPGEIDVVGGNVNDAVALTHVPVNVRGLLANPDGSLLDSRHPWFVVLRVLYDAEAEPAGDE